MSSPPPTASASQRRQFEHHEEEAATPNSKQKQQQQSQKSAAPPTTNETLAAAEKRNTREFHKDYSKGGSQIRRRLVNQVNEPLEFDAMSFQGLRLDEINRLRNEIHLRSRISNGTSWKDDVKRARENGNENTTGTANIKRSHCEGSELLLNPQPVRRHISTPRIQQDASIAKRMGDLTVTPGPLDYFPRPITSNVNSRWIGFLPSAPSKRLDDEVKTVRPSPQSYSPHKPLGAEREQWTIGKRRQFCTGGAVDDDPSNFTGPLSYPPPHSDFDVDRKFPNGATVARFYIARSMQHHAPGPLDTAPSTTTNWVWKDKRAKRWNSGGHANYMADLDPLPPSEVQARKRRQEAYDARVKEEQEQEQEKQKQEQQNEDDGENNNVAASSSARKTTTKSSNASSNNEMYKHVPALLLLHELHKQGYQQLRLVSELVTAAPKQQQQDSAEQQQPEDDDDSSSKKKKKKKAVVVAPTPVFHIASKFSVTNGNFSLKDGASKEGVAFDVTAKYLVNLQGENYLPSPLWKGKKTTIVINEKTGETKEGPYKPTAEEEKVYQDECRKFVKGEVAKGVEWFLSKNEDLAKRAKSRDFTYCSWLERILKNGLEFGDAPLKIEEEPITGTPFTLTIRGNRLGAPPLK